MTDRQMERLASVDAGKHYEQQYRKEKLQRRLLEGLLVGLVVGLLWEAIRR